MRLSGSVTAVRDEQEEKAQLPIEVRLPFGKLTFAPLLQQRLDKPLVALGGGFHQQSEAADVDIIVSRVDPPAWVLKRVSDIGLSNLRVI